MKLKKFLTSCMLILLLTMPVKADNNFRNNQENVSIFPFRFFERLKVRQKPGIPREEFRNEEKWYDLLNESIFSIQERADYIIKGFSFSPGINWQYDNKNNSILNPYLFLGFENRVSFGACVGTELNEKNKQRGVLGFELRYNF